MWKSKGQLTWNETGEIRYKKAKSTGNTEGKKKQKKYRKRYKEIKKQILKNKEEAVYRAMEAEGIIPVAVIENTEQAVPLAKALWCGGIHSVEVTFRTKGAQQAIWDIRKAYPDMLVGAGTVLTKKQVELARDAGAQFLVSPGLDEKLLLYAGKRGMVMIPGCATPTEVQAAIKHGVRMIKLFPAKACGGIDMISGLTAVYKNLRIMPTGGINKDTLEEYLSHPGVPACGGSWMVKEELLKNNDFNAVESLAKEAAEIAERARKMKAGKR